MKSHVLVAFSLLLLCFISSSGRINAQSKINVTISEIDASDFPIIRLAVGVWDERGQHVPRLKPGDFEIKEDDYVRTVKNVVVDDSVPILLSVLLDMPKDLNSPKAEMIRYSLCQLVPSQFKMNRGANSDMVEIWMPDSDAMPRLPPTDNSGTLCNWVKNISTPTYDHGQSLNKLLERSLVHEAGPRRQLVLVIASNRIDEQAIPNSEIQLERSRQPNLPIYVLSFLGDGTESDWNYLRSISSRDSQGNPLITDFAKPDTIEPQNVTARVTDLLRESLRYKSHYVLEYSSIMTRSTRKHQVIISALGEQSLPQEFSTYLPQATDWQPNTAIWLAAGIVGLMLVPFAIAIVLFLSIRRFTYP